jgi:sortase A
MRFLHIFGKFLISVGVGVLLFVLWTLKGTDIYTHNQQRHLEAEFDALPRLSPAPDTDPGDGSDEPKPPRPPVNFEDDLESGDPVFRLAIPSIDVEDMVVEGVGVDDLRKGPGHYPSCRPAFAKPLCTDFEEVFPGEKGRVIVSGHRTTYGAPFWGLDKVDNGDVINVETLWGHYEYTVFKKEIVEPDTPTVVVSIDDAAELVLTTCNPKFSASERLVVYARLSEARPA